MGCRRSGRWTVVTPFNKIESKPASTPYCPTGDRGDAGTREGIGHKTSRRGHLNIEKLRLIGRGEIRMPDPLVSGMRSNDGSSTVWPEFSRFSHPNQNVGLAVFDLAHAGLRWPVISRSSLAGVRDKAPLSRGFRSFCCK